MEQIAAGQDGVEECAVVGEADVVKGMVPVAFAVLRASANDAEGTEARIIAAVRNELDHIRAAVWA